MVYFDSWDEFAAAVEQLCVAEPKRVRNILCEFIQFRLYNYTCLFGPCLPTCYKFIFLLFFQFRFVVKYRHCDGKLVLKGTDDQVVSIHNEKKNKTTYLNYAICILLFFKEYLKISDFFVFSFSML